MRLGSYQGPKNLNPTLPFCNYFDLKKPIWGG